MQKVLPSNCGSSYVLAGQASFAATWGTPRARAEFRWRKHQQISKASMEVSFLTLSRAQAQLRTARAAKERAQAHFSTTCSGGLFTTFLLTSPSALRLSCF